MQCLRRGKVLCGKADVPVLKMQRHRTGCTERCEGGEKQKRENNKLGNQVLVENQAQDGPTLR